MVPLYHGICICKNMQIFLRHYVQLLYLNVNMIKILRLPMKGLEFWCKQLCKCFSIFIENNTVSIFLSCIRMLSGFCPFKWGKSDGEKTRGSRMTCNTHTYGGTHFPCFSHSLAGISWGCCLCRSFSHILPLSLWATPIWWAEKEEKGVQSAR